MAKSIKATITRGDVKIVLEGPKDFIEEQVAKWAGQRIESKTHNKNFGGERTPEQNSSEPRSEREVIAEKQAVGR